MLIELANSRLQEFHVGMRTVLEANTPDTAIDLYYVTFASIATPRDELNRIVGADMSLSRVRESCALA